MGFKTPKAPTVAEAPPPAPDLASKALQQAVAAQRRSSTMGQGRKSTFLTGALGDTGSVSTTLKKLLGS